MTQLKSVVLDINSTMQIFPHTFTKKKYLLQISGENVIQKGNCGPNPNAANLVYRNYETPFDTFLFLPPLNQ